MSIRRKVNELLGELRILSPESVAKRWRVIEMMLKLLIEKVKMGMKYERTYIRPWEIKVKGRTSVYNIVEMLVDFVPPILEPLEPIRIVKPPETHFTKNGVSILKNETEIWNEIFKLTDEYDMLKPLVQILRERLDEIDRYV